MAGVVHVDNQYHDSFAYDVMEPVRLYVDEWLLDFINTHVFSKKDFYETRDGGIRLTLRLTPLLAQTVTLWANKIEPVVEHVKIILVNSVATKLQKETQ
jgi:CRISPR/Cas system-associated endonuclease Cas1